MSVPSKEKFGANIKTDVVKEYELVFVPVFSGKEKRMMMHVWKYTQGNHVMGLEAAIPCDDGHVIGTDISPDGVNVIMYTLYRLSVKMTGVRRLRIMSFNVVTRKVATIGDHVSFCADLSTNATDDVSMAVLSYGKILVWSNQLMFIEFNHLGEIATKPARFVARGGDVIRTSMVSVAKHGGTIKFLGHDHASPYSRQMYSIAYIDALSGGVDVVVDQMQSDFSYNYCEIVCV